MLFTVCHICTTAFKKEVILNGYTLIKLAYSDSALKYDTEKMLSDIV